VEYAGLNFSVTSGGNFVPEMGLDRFMATSDKGKCRIHFNEIDSAFSPTLLDSYIIDELTPEIGFGKAAWKLHLAGIQLLGHLSLVDRKCLMAIRGIGPKTIEKIENSLKRRGIQLGIPNGAWADHRQSLARHVFH
jgi:hypothetical protein